MNGRLLINVSNRTGSNSAVWSDNITTVDGQWSIIDIISWQLLYFVKPQSGRAGKIPRCQFIPLSFTLIIFSHDALLLVCQVFSIKIHQQKSLTSSVNNSHAKTFNNPGTPPSLAVLTRSFKDITSVSLYPVILIYFFFSCVFCLRGKSVLLLLLWCWVSTSRRRPAVI